MRGNSANIRKLEPGTWFLLISRVQSKQIRTIAERVTEGVFIHVGWYGVHETLHDTGSWSWNTLEILDEDEAARLQALIALAPERVASFCAGDTDEI